MPGRSEVWNASAKIFSRCPSVCCPCFALVLTLKVNSRGLCPQDHFCYWQAQSSLQRCSLLSTWARSIRGAENTPCARPIGWALVNLSVASKLQGVLIPSALSSSSTQKFCLLLLSTEAAILTEVLQNKTRELLSHPAFFKSSLAVRHYIINHPKISKFENLFNWDYWNLFY